MLFLLLSHLYSEVNSFICYYLSILLNKKLKNNEKFFDAWDKTKKNWINFKQSMSYRSYQPYIESRNSGEWRDDSDKDKNKKAAIFRGFSIR